MIQWNGVAWRIVPFFFLLRACLILVSSFWAGRLSVNVQRVSSAPTLTVSDNSSTLCHPSFFFLLLCMSRYEDVAVDPVMELGRIYGWAGLGTAEPRINQWVYSTTHASTSDNAFRIQRNATKVALAWKEEMAPRQLQISNRCV